MNELTEFKKGIFKYGIIAALIAEAISLAAIGFNTQFAYGLALGTCIAIVNFNILAFCCKKVVDGGGAFASLAGYLFRMMIYGFAFYMSVKISLYSAAGTVIGFLTLKIGLYYLHGFKPKFSESSAKGKVLNDLDNDGWPKKKKRWYHFASEEEGVKED